MLHKISGLTIIVLILFALTTSCSEPNQQTKLPQWTAEDVPYGTDKQQTFNILLPKEKNNVHAIIYIHGGFYYSGDKLWYPLFLKEYSGDNIFVTMDYRLIQLKNNTVHIRDMISDVHNALLKIREVSEESGVLIKDYILAGHSAGAHLALLYGYKYFEKNINNGIDIAACIGLSGPADYSDDLGWSSMTYYGEDLQERLETLSWMGTELTGYTINLTQANWTEQNNYNEFKKYVDEISPVKYVDSTKKLPPTLLVHGPDDIIVPYSNSLRLNNALDNTSIPHKLITVTGTGNNHMLGGAPNISSGKPITYKKQPWINEVKEWIEVYIGHTKVQIVP